MAEEQPCSSQIGLISVLCVALLIMTLQSIILGIIYLRYKRRQSSVTQTSQPSGSNSGHRNRSNRSNNSTDPRPNPEITQSAPTQVEEPPEYAVVDRNQNNSSRDSNDMIYMNQTPAPKAKITKKMSNAPTPPTTLAIDNALYTDMEALKQESIKRGLSAGSNKGSTDMVVDNDTYFNTGSITKKPVVPKRQK